MSALSQPCLVLNKSWFAIGACTVKSALRLLILDKAMIVDPHSYETTRVQHTLEFWLTLKCTFDEPHILSTHGPVKRPQVIALTKYNKHPSRNIKFTRRNVYVRDDFVCQYCGKELNTGSATVDHLVPKSKGGKTNFSNCVTSCYECNNKKDNRTVQEANMSLSRLARNNGQIDRIVYTMPKTPKWLPSFLGRFGKAPPEWDKFLQRDRS